MFLPLRNALLRFHQEGPSTLSRIAWSILLYRQRHVCYWPPALCRLASLPQGPHCPIWQVLWALPGWSCPRSLCDHGLALVVASRFLVRCRCRILDRVFRSQHGLARRVRRLKGAEWSSPFIMACNCPHRHSFQPILSLCGRTWRLPVKLSHSGSQARMPWVVRSWRQKMAHRVLSDCLIPSRIVQIPGQYLWESR